MKLTDIQHILTQTNPGEIGLYQWECYPNSIVADYSNLFAEIAVIQNVNNGNIYELTVYTKNDQVYPNQKAYRWIDPDFKNAVELETKNRGCDHSIAFDSVKFIDIDVECDILEKASAIVNGEQYDERVVMSLDIDDTLFLNIAKQAHERDITINHMFEEIITEAVNSYAKELKISE